MASRVSLSVAILFVCKFGIYLCVDDNLGPADISIERLEECSESEKYSSPMEITMNRYNRSHAAFNGCVLIPDPGLGPGMALNLTAAKWGDGGWKPNAFNYAAPDVCEALDKQVKEAWIIIQTNFKRSELGCPLPEGKHCLDNMVMELDGLFPSMLYGTFRVDMAINNDKMPVFCIRAYLKSTKSKNKKGR